MKREILGVKSCTDQCHLKGYPFAAIQNAQFCMCSGKYGRYGLADDESECRRQCLAGSPDEKCGGPWKNAVYKIGKLYANFFASLHCIFSFRPQTIIHITFTLSLISISGRQSHTIVASNRTTYFKINIYCFWEGPFK